MRPGPRNSITDVAGISVGQVQRTDDGWATGTTVVLAPDGATAGVDVRGGGPGTRETDLLDPSHLVQQVQAVVLTGGSAFGLAAADGVVHWLAERGYGFDVGAGRVVPIVPAAVLFDLHAGGVGNVPDAGFGWRACGSAGPVVAQGCAGAGTGARAGVLKGGVGTASVVLVDGPAAGVTVAALMAVNPAGAVVSPRTGLPWGVDHELAGEFGLCAPATAEVGALARLADSATRLNTTIGVVATDAGLSKPQCRRMAVAAHDGLARAVRPAHSMLDGDTVFALATGADRAPSTAAVRGPAAGSGSGWGSDELPAPVPVLVLDAITAAAADCVARAIVHAVLAAEGSAGVPSYRDVLPSAFS